MNKVFRVWFDHGMGEVCCVIVSAPNSDKALELAKNQVVDFPELLG